MSTTVDLVTPLRRPGLSATLRSEWIKLASLRSSWLTLAVTAIVMVVIGAVAAAASASGEAVGAPGSDGSDPLSTVLTGANFAMLILGVLGCLTGAREYSSRMITTTFVATPRRWRVVAAKALVLTAVVVPVAAIGTFGAYAAGTAVLEGAGEPTVALSDSGALGSLLGMVLWLTCVSLLGLALGFLLRSTASSIGSLLGVVLILPPIAGALLPDSTDAVLQVLPSNAAAAFTTITATGDIDISGAVGVVIVLAWTVGLLAVALRRVVTQDA